jgi:hypothetical protein
MYWQAMRVDPWLDEKRLRAAFAAVFRLDPSRIEVTDDPASLVGPIPPEPRILLEVFRRDGPFPLQLDVFLAADEIEREAVPLDGALRYARALARHLNATLLFGDGPIGHDEQLRVTPDGTVDVVELDGDEFDEDRIVVVGAHPLPEQALDGAPARAS